MEKNILYLEKNNKATVYAAFTLLECLLALFLLSIICLLFSAMIKNAGVVTTRIKDSKEKEWQVFLIQMENELKHCQYITVQTNKIILKNKKKKHPVYLEFKLGKLVKVENGGYQPLLTEVKQASFIDEKQAVRIDIIFDNYIQVQAKWVITKEHRNESYVSR